jgi:hypothetical protein
MDKIRMLEPRMVSGAAAGKGQAFRVGKDITPQDAEYMVRRGWAEEAKAETKAEPKPRGKSGSEQD